MNIEMPTYIDNLYLMDSLKEYASPRAKVTTMIKAGELVKVRRGLYLNPHHGEWSIKTLANKVLGPSYISFEYALSYYGLIPERVYAVTSASMGKNKRKHFHTAVGDFEYYSIHPRVYHFGIELHEEKGYPFLIASKEKALCDMLSKVGQVGSITALRELLLRDLRIDTEQLRTLHFDDITFLASRYRKKAVSLFARYLAKERIHA